MKNLFVFLVAAFCFLLVGCTPQIKYVDRIQYVGIDIPEKFLYKTKRPSPPEKEKFMNSSVIQQRDQLFFYSMEVSQAAQTCQSNVNSIGKIYEEHLKALEKANAKELAEKK